MLISLDPRHDEMKKRECGQIGKCKLPGCGSALERVPTTNSLRQAVGTNLWTSLVILSIAPYRRGES